MEIQKAIELFKRLEPLRSDQNKKYSEAKRYYLNQNDITLSTQGESKVDNENEEELFRKADSRVSNNFYRLLVDQKASYVGSVAPRFDLGNKPLNKLITDTLGDKFSRTLQRMVIDSSNAGCSWLHVWKDDDNGEFKYAIVPPDQVVPIYNNELERKLIAVRRTYSEIDDETSHVFNYEQYWTDKEAYFYKWESSIEDMVVDNSIQMTDATTQSKLDPVNVIEHGFDGVPFIHFPNNLLHTNDLDTVKGIIDVYDSVYNGFVNDVKDIQQVILTLTNYGGEDMKAFMDDMRRYKIIKFDSFQAGDASGLGQVQIDIPVEARNILLDKTLDAIFLQGQGVNPTKLELGNNSGVALKMLYGLLELKASALESEYRVSFNKLIRFILQFHGKDSSEIDISQTWERASIQNWQEKSEMVSKLADITSKKNIAYNNPLVEDPEEELKLLEAQNSSDTFDSDNPESESESDSESESENGR